ncbi:MAG TPA: hypothetical protein VJ824_16900 [Bacillota bacterium]|nr:hypothetical protein [Bacillota bacterium]
MNEKMQPNLTVINGLRKYRFSKIRLKENTNEFINYLSFACGISKTEMLEEIVEVAINDPDFFHSMVRRHNIEQHVIKKVTQNLMNSL